jgi:hypothetical protein
LRPAGPLLTIEILWFRGNTPIGKCTAFGVFAILGTSSEGWDKSKLWKRSGGAHLPDCKTRSPLSDIRGIWLRRCCTTASHGVSFGKVRIAKRRGTPSSEPRMSSVSTAGTRNWRGMPLARTWSSERVQIPAASSQGAILIFAMESKVG